MTTNVKVNANTLYPSVTVWAISFDGLGLHL